MQLPTDQIVVSKDIYPRSRPDDSAVRRYRDNIDLLPPVDVALIGGQYLLVDGYHRILAHKLENRPTVEANLREDLADSTAVLDESIRLNAAHGLQLTREDKEQMACLLCRRYNTEHIAVLLAVGESTVKRWTRRVKELEAFENRVEGLARYLAGETEAQIAEAVPGLGDRTSVGRFIDRDCVQNGHLVQMHTILTSTSGDEDTQQRQSIIRQHLGAHLLDPASPPPSLKVYDVWNFTKCDPHYGAEYPGRVPGQILENLLWYYTKPLDRVYDAFAGGGTTIDVCRAMFRRWWASDIRPFDETKGIRKHDIAAGRPDFFPKGYRMDFTFLDPPYWCMKDAEYPDGSLSGLDLAGFYAGMAAVAEHTRAIAADGGHLALIVQNQTGEGKANFEGQAYLDHAFDLRLVFKSAGWVPVRRISCPLPPDNNGGANEAKAKDDRRMLGLVRDILVFRNSGPEA